MAGMTGKGTDFAGDYGTPEQNIPANGIPGQDWESCMTMNDTWGFSSHDHNWKSSTTLIRNLVDCASKGGNYLLNVGPTSLGEIPDESIQRLSEVGDWMKKYSESVYGTKASPFPRALPWGKVTQKPGKLYLNVFDRKTSTIDLPGLKTKVKSVKLMGGQMLKFEQSADGVKIMLPTLPDEASTVLVANIDGAPVVVAQALQQKADGTISLDALDAKVSGSTAQYESDKAAIGFWTSLSDTVSWTVNVKKGGKFHVYLQAACEPGAEGATFDLETPNGKLSGKVPSTGGWGTFAKLDLGTISLPGSGLATFTVRPLTMPGLAVMNLRSIVLQPE
jgi:alpha-L-fucosidase